MKPGRHASKPKKPVRVLRIALIVLAALVLVYSLYRLGKLYFSYRTSEKAYTDLAESAVTIQPADSQNAEAPETPPSPAASGDPQSATAENDTAVLKRPEVTAPVRRTITVPEQAEDGTEERREYIIDVDFEALLDVNLRTAAWLYSPDTEINYPVMQSADNLDFLRNLPDGRHSEGGSLFIDYRLNGFSGYNTVIYGHYRKYGGMFSSLLNYREQSYYDAHRLLYLFTPDHSYELRVIAVLSVPDDDPRCYDMDMTEEEFAAYLDYAEKHSVVETGFKAANETVERVVGLSTCSYEFANSRLVLLCSMVCTDP